MFIQASPGSSETDELKAANSLLTDMKLFDPSNAQNDTKIIQINF